MKNQILFAIGKFIVLLSLCIGAYTLVSSIIKHKSCETVVAKTVTGEYVEVFNSNACEVSE